jgi:uncharacterized protein with ParB-like and HNH nuclease domain
MEIIPDKRKVVGLIEHAYEGKICLPNFQRDFVWTREEVADLVRSIIRGYFIGSLLLLRAPAGDLGQARRCPQETENRRLHEEEQKEG